jgi:two-component system CheB/CheR fusion protein
MGRCSRRGSLKAAFRWWKMRPGHDPSKEKDCLAGRGNYVDVARICGKNGTANWPSRNLFRTSTDSSVMRKINVIKASRRGSVNPSPSRRKVKPAAPTPPLATVSSHGSFPVVGIGASAGGLEATTQLLRNLPQSPGLAFVLVPHLEPTHESALSALLSRTTSMPVSEARNNLRLEPNRVYVIPPNRIIALEERRLKVSPRRDSREVHRPIDHFLESLAEEERDRAIGVILSGNGSDGTRGLLAIRATGGITFAQDEKSAKFHGMPASAIAAGCVDRVLPPEQIAGELARIAGHPSVPSSAACEELEREQPAEEKAFNQILAILRQRTGVDFTHYRHATLQRRVQRRMVLRKFESPQAYADHLLAHATEFKELFDDILIHVTGFFHEASLYHAFRKKLFPALLKNKAADEPIRIWVPGCSAGQEVCSIAIALVEFMDDRKQHHPVQIFGTDIQDSALEKARAGVYAEAIESEISPERLRRFFQKTDCGHRINKSIREMCIFARQNVAVDPPFSNLDLISCRNVLVYLGATLQRKVIPKFHYALKSNGFLVLGASETVGGFSDLFSLLDKKVRIYIKKTTHLRPAVTFDDGSPDPGVAPGRQQPTPPTLAGPSLADLQKHADRILLTNYCPAGVIINQHMEVLQFRGPTGPFLEHTRGETNFNLFAIAREGLIPGLRASVTKAIKRNVRVLLPGVRVSQNGYAVEATVEVIPYSLPPSQDKFYLVLFRRRSREAEATAEEMPRDGKDAAPRSGEHVELVRLNEELAATRESLQSIIEEQEATMEELRSANEEITSSNEQLQSTNEELETAREELQSTNEELTTLNDVLEHRNTELEHANNDLHNVLGNVNIPIIVLGADLRIRRFTFVAEKLCGLCAGDVGRPITDINLQLDGPDLSKVVLEAIDNLTTKDLEVKDRSGHWYSARIRPYKTINNKIEGAIIAFVDMEPRTENRPQ